jgi:hypothetical protein
MPKLPFLAALMLAASGAAVAQYDTRFYGVSNIDTRIERLEERIDRQVERGRIGREDAALLDRELRGIRTVQRQYGRNGLSQWESTDLHGRIDAIEADLRETDTHGRGDPSYPDVYYPDPSYEEEGRGSPEYGQDDRRWRDRGDWRNEDRAGPDRYEADDGLGLQPVPNRFRGRYRDTERSYFRYRGGYVHEFDRRSGAILNSIWVGE